MELGQKIKKIREEKRLSQDSLGELAKMNGRHISRIENGHIKPTIEILKKLAKSLDVSIDYLVYDNIPKKKELNKVFDPELLDLVYAMEILPEEKVYVIKEIIKDALFADKASAFVEESKRPYNRKK